MSKHILVGSKRFFTNIQDYKSKDADYVILVENPIGFDNVRQTCIADRCIFEWRKMTAEEFVNYVFTKGPAMQVGKFLVPEFVEAIGFTIQHLQQLREAFEHLDPKHAYEKIIYEAYIQNNSFTLTDEQLQAAYESYKQARKDIQMG